MSTTPQLGITHITAAQNNKEVTANEAFDALDNAMNKVEFIELNATTGMDQTVASATALARGMIVLNGTHDGSATDPFLLYVPAVEKSYTFVNESSGEVEVLGENDTIGTGVLLSVGDVAYIHYDGTKFRSVTASGSSGGGGGGASALADLSDVQTAATDLQDGDVLTWSAAIGAWVAGEPGSGGGGASDLGALTDVDLAGTDLQDGDILGYDATLGAWRPVEQAANTAYDISFFLPGEITEPDERLVQIVAARPFTVPENFDGSQAYAAVGAGDSFDTVLSVQKNGIEIGTITFQPGSQTGVFSTGTDTGASFAAGDRLEVYGPAESEAIDSTLAAISVTLKATRG